MAKVKTLKTEKREVQTISLDIWEGKQSANYKHIFDYDKYKLRISIKVDSYVSQSSATLCVWHPEQLEWKTVYSLVGQIMETQQKLHYQTSWKNAKTKSRKESFFEDDFIHLLKVFEGIVL